MNKHKKFSVYATGKQKNNATQIHSMITLLQTTTVGVIKKNVLE